MNQQMEERAAGCRPGVPPQGRQGRQHCGRAPPRPPSGKARPPGRTRRGALQGPLHRPPLDLRPRLPDENRQRNRPERRPRNPLLRHLHRRSRSRPARGPRPRRNRRPLLRHRPPLRHLRRPAPEAFTQALTRAWTDAHPTLTTIGTPTETCTDETCTPQTDREPSPPATPRPNQTSPRARTRSFLRFITRSRPVSASPPDRSTEKSGTRADPALMRFGTTPQPPEARNRVRADQDQAHRGHQEHPLPGGSHHSGRRGRPGGRASAA